MCGWPSPLTKAFERWNDGSWLKSHPVNKNNSFIMQSNNRHVLWEKHRSTHKIMVGWFLLKVQKVKWYIMWMLLEIIVFLIYNMSLMRLLIIALQILWYPW